MISIRPQFVEAILSGDKTVELRRRAFNLHPGDRLWIYTTFPKAAVQASAIIEDVLVAEPMILWEKVESSCRLTKSEFDSYFVGAVSACAIRFRDVFQVAPEISLNALRQEACGFHPPQNLMWIPERHPLWTLFQSILETSTIPALA
ncbi:MAG: ASCH domain-containing protein [Kiloniellales bacterium]